MAVAAAAVMVMACIGGAALTGDDEVDAIPPVVIALAYIGTFLAGFGAGYVLAEYLHQDIGSLSQAIYRQLEVTRINEEIGLVISASNVNAMKNYAQLWGFTSEHFARAAELAASAAWRSDATFSPERILYDAAVYGNAANGLGSSAAQVSEFFDFCHLCVTDKWPQNVDLKNDGVRMSWTYGSRIFGGTSDFDGDLVLVALPTVGADRVFLPEGATVWSPGGASTIRADSGDVLAVADSGTQVAVAGVYTLTDGSVIAADRMCPTATNGSARLKTGVIIRADSDLRLAYFEDLNTTSLSDDRIIVDGTAYPDLSIRTSAAHGFSKSTDITEALRQFQAVADVVADVVGAAASSAAAVWDIFNRMGHASHYITTLSVPDIYENVAMSATQKELLTILSMEQIAQYWQLHPGDVKKNLTVTAGSNLLFCRGDIYDTFGHKLYENVVFTPYFYQHDQTLRAGTQTVDQYGLVAVWARDVPALTGWSGNSSSDAAVVHGHGGYRYDIAEMLYDGAPTTSVDLVVRALDYIDPEEMTPTPLPPRPHDKSWIQIALVIIGALLIAGGLIRRDPVLIAVGAVIAAAGILLGDRLGVLRRWWPL